MPHGIDAQAAQLGRQQVEYGRAALWIVHSADVSHRLMQQHVDVFRRLVHHRAIDAHFIAPGMNARPLGGHDDAVDLHAPGGD